MRTHEIIDGLPLVVVDGPPLGAERLQELSHPCVERFVIKDGELFRSHFGPSVSLLTLADVSSTPRGNLEPEILASILGRAALGILEVYALMAPPLRAIEAEGIRLYRDGQVRFNPLPYLRPSGPHDDRPFIGAPAGSAPVAPFPLRPMAADAYALIMLFYELVSDSSVRPFNEERPTSVLEVGREMIEWGARVEEDLGGVFRGLLEKEFTAQLRDSEVTGDDLEEPPDLDARVRVDDLEIDRHLVTCARYARFCVATGHAPPGAWRSRECPAGHEDLPVTGIGHQDARAFAEHVRGRLLRAEEWRECCLGRYPGGDAYDDAGSSRAWLEPFKVRTPRPLAMRNVGRAGVANLCELWEFTLEGDIVGGPFADEIAPGAAAHKIVEENPRRDLGFRVAYVD